MSHVKRELGAIIYLPTYLLIYLFINFFVKWLTFLHPHLEICGAVQHLEVCGAMCFYVLQIYKRNAPVGGLTRYSQIQLDSMSRVKNNMQLPPGVCRDTVFTTLELKLP